MTNEAGLEFEHLEAALMAQIKELKLEASSTSCGDGNFERAKQRAAEQKADELQAKLDALTKPRTDKADLVELEAAIKDIQGDLISHPSVRLQTHRVITVLEAAKSNLSTLNEPAPVTDAGAQEALDAFKRIIETHDLQPLSFLSGAICEKPFKNADDIARDCSIVYRALSRPASGMELPVLPDGWMYNGWKCYIRTFQEQGQSIELRSGEGTTPHEAAEAAIAKTALETKALEKGGE